MVACSPGRESSVRSAQLIRRWGLPRESAPWSGTGDGEVLMGRRFWVGCGWFFSWGGGGGEEETPGHGLLSRFFAGRRESPNSPFFYVIYYILSSGSFAASSFRASRKVPSTSTPWADVSLFKCRQLDDLFHTLKTVKGLLHLVPPRTPRNSGYGVLCTCGLCYMLFLLYV